MSASKTPFDDPKTKGLRVKLPMHADHWAKGDRYGTLTGRARIFGPTKIKLVLCRSDGGQSGWVPYDDCILADE